MVNLHEKVVIITGASSGIGRATAVLFALKGAAVVLAARRIDRLEELKKIITEFNEKCICVQTDVTREQDVVRLFDETEKHFGAVDILVNNAGRGLKARITDTDADQWRSVIATNLDSVFYCSREAIKRMQQTGAAGTTGATKGHIITVCSVAGLYGGPTYAAYCASKHGVAGFMRSLKWEVRRDGIKASTIFPARVDTEFFADYKKKPHKSRMLSAVDIADYIVALATRCPCRIAAVRMKNLFKRLRTLIGL